MRIPQQADKWVVFGLTLGLCVVHLLPVIGEPGHLAPVAWVVIPLLFGAASTAFYVVWCMGCRWAARLLGMVPNSAGVQIFAGASFLALLLIVMFYPIATHAVLQDLPPER